MDKTSKAPTKRNQILSGIIISLITLILLLALLEGVTRLLTKNIPTDVGQIRGADAPAYQNAEYITPEFMAEIPQSNRLYKVEGVNLLLNEDFDGKYINVIGGARVTSDQPENYTHTIYLFGGSPVFGSEVPDEFTLASYLQRDLNAYFGDTYRVVNLGVISMSIEQQLNRLKITDIKEGDIVLFYDGFNDATIMYSEAYDPETIPWESNQQTTKLGSLFRGFINTLTRHSHFAYYVLGFHNFKPRFLNDEAQIAQLQENMENYLLPLYLEANAYSQKHNAQFVQMLQPCIFNLPQFTPQESLITSARPLVPNGWAEAIRLGYEVLRDMSDAMNAEGIPSYDLSHVLDPQHRPSENTEIYLDYVQVNHIGNEIIAENIFNHLQPLLEEQVQP